MTGGLRILALGKYGGGTRNLSTLLVLREILDQIVPGQGGRIRPSEYFDIIGASGQNALAALLFVRFAFSVDEALKFCYEFASRMEKADEVFRAKRGEDFDENDWKELEEEFPEPEVQIETVRRQVLSNTWSELITREVTDWLERSNHKENGKFNYKSPDAYVGVGRCRAAVMGSEGPGYGGKGGVVEDHRYNVPRWHRSYKGRHTASQYTLYAIALGTCAFPGIISNGLVFPEFSAPGTHIVHNPVELLLEECGKVWPGLQASLILSIGTGKLALPEKWDYELRPYGLAAANASLKISEAASATANSIEKYIIPHHKMYQNAYFRFDVSSSLPLFEYEGKADILSKTSEYLQDGQVATNIARVADILEEDTFPTIWEDHVAMSSLAFLMTTFASTGHNDAAEMVSDALSSYFLYEPTRLDSGTRRKLIMAVGANKLADDIRRQSSLTNLDWRWQRKPETYAADYFLNTIMAYGEVEGIPAERYHGGAFDQLNSLSDIAAAAYYVLTVIRSQNRNWLDGSTFSTVLRQVTSIVTMAAEITPALTSRLDELLTISSISSICEAAYLEYLTAEPRLLLNGSFIRRLTNIVLQIDLQRIDTRLLDPVASAIAAIIHLGKWSSIRDSLIVKLLEGQQPQSANWAFVNLAVEWKAQAVSGQDAEPSSATSDCDRACQQLLEDLNESFSHQKVGVSVQSVKHGYLGLLRKTLEGSELQAKPGTGVLRPCAPADFLLSSAVTAQGENLLHLSTKSAFIPTTKMIVEALGTVQAKKHLVKKDSNGFCPLHIACRRHGDLDTVLLCLYAGADLDVIGPGGRTALHFCFPQKGDIQNYVPIFEKFTHEHGMLLTLPLKSPRAWGMLGKGQEIGHDVFLLRRLSAQLVCRGASINKQDDWGQTPAHLAAANGWGVNVDTIFSRTGPEAEDRARDCLLMRDRQGHSVLSLMRATADEEGERIILAEMRKRCMDTSTSSHSRSSVSPPAHGTGLQSKDRPDLHIPSQPDFTFRSDGIKNSATQQMQTGPQSPDRQGSNAIPAGRQFSINRKPLVPQAPSQYAQPSSPWTPPQQYASSASSPSPRPPATASERPWVVPAQMPRQTAPPAPVGPTYSPPAPQYSPPPRNTPPFSLYAQHAVPLQPVQQPQRSPIAPQATVPQPAVPQAAESSPLYKANPSGEKRGSKLLKKIFK